MHMEPQEEHLPQQQSPSVVPAESLLTVLGVVYSHRKTSDGGDMYLTRFGLHCADALEIDNWYEKEWFEARRERLEGTSAVYYVPSREVNGRSVELVVKNCRVGEDVPLETHTLMEFINTEFNSPWEEFAIVMELREGKYGPPDIRCNTQEPLAIYVPPGKMQVWQSGRSYAKINRIRARHPGIDIDILRQYKLIYGWIRGKDLPQVLTESGMASPELDAALAPLTKKATDDLDKKGFVMADMKPCHVIIGEEDAKKVETIVGATDEDTRRLRTRLLSDLMAQGSFSVIDYELLVRTPPHEEEVHWSRRHSYLDDQRNRFLAADLPPYLSAEGVLDVPYVFGEVQSTAGRLWVVGRNARLFDYFLPERWRKTHAWKLSESNDVYYTVTKDHIHLVWKVSRIGDRPVPEPGGSFPEKLEEYGYNSPFEAFAIAQHLNKNGVPTVYSRAIYMTGTVKEEQPVDQRRYDSHRMLRDARGGPLLCEDHDYIMLWGYFNGTDEWVAAQTGMQLCRPFNLEQAVVKALIDEALSRRLFDKVQTNLRNLGYDGALLRGNDLLLALDPDNKLLKDAEGLPEVRICSFELIKKI
jgi:hypothetical protein